MRPQTPTSHSEESIQSIEVSPMHSDEALKMLTSSVDLVYNEYDSRSQSTTPLSTCLTLEQPAEKTNAASFCRDEGCAFSEPTLGVQAAVISDLAGELPRERVRKEKTQKKEKMKARTAPSSIQKRLFVTGRAADALCMASGGHFDLVKRSGMNLSGPTTKLVRLQIISAKPPAMQLSTDFRCGTYGSQYDIAVRSGCKVHEPLTTSARRSRPKRRNAYLSRSDSRDSIRSQRSDRSTKRETHFIPACGGAYDTVMRSGLTKEKLRSRATLSVSTTQQVESTKQADIVSEDISDTQCGASSSLSILLASPFDDAPVQAKKHLYAIKEVNSVEVD